MADSLMMMVVILGISGSQTSHEGRKTSLSAFQMQVYNLVLDNFIWFNYVPEFPLN